MAGCKTRVIIGTEAYFLYAAVTNDTRNEADGYFSTACLLSADGRHIAPALLKRRLADAVALRF